MIKIERKTFHQYRPNNVWHIQNNGNTYAKVLGSKTQTVLMMCSEDLFNALTDAYDILPESQEKEKISKLIARIGEMSC